MQGMMDMQIALTDGGNMATDDCGQILKWKKMGHTGGQRQWMDTEMYDGRDLQTDECGWILKCMKEGIHRQIIVDGYRNG